MMAKLNQRVADLTQEKDELNNNLDVVSKKVFNLEKSESYQNSVMDRLERERAKLEMANVTISDRMQKFELELMNKTKKKEDLEALLEKEQSLVERLKNDAITTSNRIIELECEIGKRNRTFETREKELREKLAVIESEIGTLQKKREEFRQVVGRVKLLQKTPFRIEQKMKSVHLFGMKITR